MTRRHPCPHESFFTDEAPDGQPVQVCEDCGACVATGPTPRVTSAPVQMSYPRYTNA